MRISDSMIASSLVAQMQRASARLFRFQEQVASGLAFTRPSENPPGAVQAASLRGSIAELTRYRTNCDEARAALALTEGVLAGVYDSLRVARDAALAMNPSSDSGNEALADEVHVLSAKIVAEANFASGGRYLLGGHEVLTRPVVENAAGPPPYLYQGDRGDMVVRLSRTVTVVTNVDAAEVLNLDGAADPARDDVLELLGEVEAALRAGDQKALEAGLEEMDWHLDRVVSLRAQVGTRMQQVELGKGRLEGGILTFRNLLSEVQDVDITEAVIGLRSQEITYQAAAAAAASIHRASLLDYF